MLRPVFNRRLGVALTWTVATLGPATAYADDDPTAAERAAGEALFEEGRRFVEQGRLDEACPRLERAVNIVRRTATGGLFELAACYEAAGKIASAWTTFSEAEAKSAAQGRADRADAARARKNALGPRLHFVIAVVGDAAPKPANVTAWLDGNPVAVELLAAAFPADPGIHTLKLEAPGFRPTETTFEVPRVPGKTQIFVPDFVSLAPPSEPEPPRPTIRPREDEGLGTPSVVGIVGLATGGVAMGVGAVLFFAAEGAYPSQCQSDDGAWIDSEACRALAGEANDARSLGNAAGGAFWGGATVAAVGAVFLVLGSMGGDVTEAQRLPITACDAPGFALCLTGSFR